ncbi:MAG: 1,4-alpha-glucan branching protein domain-containing protein [Planctomycetota bacterium]
MPKGYLSFVLHSHLPFVRHPDYPDFMEEDWLFEAITECYLPLVDVFERLTGENTPFKLTINVSPPLCEMLQDSLLKTRYNSYLSKLIELSEKEITRTAGTPFADTSRMYHERFRHIKDIYYKYSEDIISAFRKFQDAGSLEIITCGATHGFLPLMLRDEAVMAQVQVAVNNYQKHFHRPPRGIWLPECAYKPGVEKALARAGIKYFIVDTHGLIYAQPSAPYEANTPVYCNGVYAFGRDQDASKQVWSADEGYPGDTNYREFYRDLGYDAPYQYIRPYLHSDGVRRNTGIKYHRITGRVQLNEKEPYNYANALAKVEANAFDFLLNRRNQIKYLAEKHNITPIVVAPYDTELFGHWWFEGPEFICALLKKIAGQSDIGLITPSEYINLYPNQPVCEPSMSTWGDKGYNEVWLNGKNDWVYRHLHQAEDKMVELTATYPNAQSILKEILNQMARELLLAQSSDWAFLMTTGHSESYAHNRFKNHIVRFNTLYKQVKSQIIDHDFLQQLKVEDNIFPEMDYRVYAG